MKDTPPENNDPGAIRLTDSGNVIAALPYLLGFRPTDSIVVVALAPGEPAAVLATVRGDLPDPDEAMFVAARLVVPLLDRGPDRVILAVIGSPEGSDVSAGSDLPARTFIEQCEAAMNTAGIDVAHSLWAATTTAGVPWRCYDDANCGGVVPDLASSELAAAAVLAGQVTHASREEMLADLAPAAPAVLARHTALLDTLAAQHQSHSADRYRRFHRLDAAVRRAQQGAVPGAEESMRLVLALRDHLVRDACLIHTVGQSAEGAQRLWRHLVRVTPAPDRAEPALLLALTHYMRGDGIWTGMSLEVALKADRRHRMARLIREALYSAMPPDELRSVISRMAVEAHELVMASRPARPPVQ